MGLGITVMSHDDIGQYPVVCTQRCAKSITGSLYTTPNSTLIPVLSPRCDAKSEMLAIAAFFPCQIYLRYNIKTGTHTVNCSQTSKHVWTMSEFVMRLKSCNCLVRKSIPAGPSGRRQRR